MMQDSSKCRILMALCGLVVIGACSGAPPTAPAELPVLMRSEASLNVVSDLAVCRVRSASSASAMIGPRGGTLSHGGHRLTIEKGVLKRPTRFTITRLTGKHLRVGITASGSEHYSFRAPVSVTISYAGCERQHRLAREATVVYLPDDPNRSPEAMGGVVDRRSRSITFQTTHLSTYAVAY